MTFAEALREALAWPDGLANAAHAYQRRKHSVYGRPQLTQLGEGAWPRSAGTYDPAPVNRAVRILRVAGLFARLCLTRG